ncbi:MAG: phosphopentomutase, partial [Proteobacteria bacterium]|nr:phosphopentomutase [Pseudomonadota bacterium]
MTELKRAVILVIDSGGVGEMPDAGEYGDRGSDTIGHVAARAGGLNLPTLRRLGLGNLHRVKGVDPLDRPEGSYGRMLEKSAGKDTITGHWEMTGLVTQVPFVTFPDGFPPEIMKPFEEAIGRGTLGNKAASGTDIISELGEEHMRTGKPIVYTSADSVFQVAAHEEVIPIDELYRICEIARAQLVGPYQMGRVIARPFVGQPGAFTRTYRRRDYAVDPPGETAVSRIAASGRKVTGVGKIKDIYNGIGITESHKMKNNLDGLEVTLDVLKKDSSPGLIFTNLVDFDMLFGHRNDADGYAKALLELDSFLPRIMESMTTSDALFITADHGCDPTILSSTDHTREYVPLMVWGPGLKSGQDLGT